MYIKQTSFAIFSIMCLQLLNSSVELCVNVRTKESESVKTLQTLRETNMMRRNRTNYRQVNQAALFSLMLSPAGELEQYL